MDGQWKEVARLRFEGERFRDHALDLDALRELGQFQTLVAQTARALWRAENPDRQRLPSHFEQRTRLCLRSIEEGSVSLPLEVFVPIPEQPELWEPEPVEANQAVATAYDVFEAVETDSEIPERVPKALLPEYAKLGEYLSPTETLAFNPVGRKPLKVTARARSRLLELCAAPYEDDVSVEGEVLETDIRHRRFQFWLDDGTGVQATFSASQEDIITTALKDHRAVKIHVKGRAEFSPEGTMQRIVKTDALRIVPSEEENYDLSAPPIEEVLRDIAQEVPAEEWKRLPADLSQNLDRYVYGSSGK